MLRPTKGVGLEAGADRSEAAQSRGSATIRWNRRTCEHSAHLPEFGEAKAR
jgi:hypothetical protein